MRRKGASSSLERAVSRIAVSGAWRRRRARRSARRSTSPRASLEIPFMRDDLAGMRESGAEGAAMMTDAPQQLATRMHDAWVAFASTGDPGWPAYDVESRQTMVFDESSAVLNDPAAKERLAWKGKR